MQQVNPLTLTLATLAIIGFGIFIVPGVVRKSFDGLPLLSAASAKLLLGLVAIGLFSFAVSAVSQLLQIIGIREEIESLPEIAGAILLLLITFTPAMIVSQTLVSLLSKKMLSKLSPRILIIITLPISLVLIFAFVAYYITHPVSLHHQSSAPAKKDV